MTSFIIFIFQRPFDQLGNQGDITSPLAAAPSRQCANKFFFFFVSLSIRLTFFFFFFASFTIRLTSMFIHHDLEPTYISSFNDQHVKPIFCTLKQNKLLIFFQWPPEAEVILLKKNLFITSTSVTWSLFFFSFEIWFLAIRSIWYSFHRN